MLYRFMLVRKMKHMLDSIANEPHPPQIKIMNINLVRMDHAVLAYDSDTDMFLGQGTTKDELVELLRKRFPNTNFMAKSHNLKEINLQ